MDNLPQVSVIIPVYNAVRYLAEAIASVRSQNYSALELIVVDDGSTDGSAALVRSLGDDLVYHYQPRRGPAAARNTGLAAASGELIAFIDADDLWPVGKLDLQVGRLLEQPDLEVVTGRVQFFGLETPAMRKTRFEGPDKTAIHVNLGAAVFRRSAFVSVGEFDEQLGHWEDLDWFMRARELGVRIRILKQVTLRYRIHESNYSQASSGEHDFMLVLSRSAARRRRMNISASALPAFSDFDER